MVTQLFQFHTYPNDVAITKTDFIDDGVFFLDFSRPLERLRWFGVNNRWIGPTVNLLVPVAHQSEENGGFVVGIQRSDPYFGNIVTLWKERSPSKRNAPKTEANGLKIIADFTTQFPGDSEPPRP